MPKSDAFDFPEIHVKSVDLSEPLSVSPQPPTPSASGTCETKGERLARQRIQCWQIKHEAEQTMKRLRTEIEKMLADGEFVGNTVGYVTWQTSKILKADSLGLFETIGPSLFVRVSEVPTPQIRGLIEAGHIGPDASCLQWETVRRLVTRFR